MPVQKPLQKFFLAVAPDQAFSGFIHARKNGESPKAQAQAFGQGLKADLSELAQAFRDVFTP